MIARACYVACDRCHEAAPVTTDGSKDARVLARAEGFIVTATNEDVCPRCAGKVWTGLRWTWPAESPPAREPSLAAEVAAGLHDQPHP